MEERLQEATLQQTKSNASYNSTMTENSKSQAKFRTCWWHSAWAPAWA